ncbi:MAG: hypothetical protein ABIP48_05245, partial [Planctomycetota bacterium]
RRENEKKYYGDDVRAIAILSGHPDRVLGKTGAVTMAFETAVAEGHSASRQFLADNKLAVVFTDSPTVVPQLAAIWRYGGSFLGYKIFYDPHQIEWHSTARPPSERLDNFLNAKWTNGIEFVGFSAYGESGSDFPDYLVTQWRIPGGVVGPCQAEWEFVALDRKSDSFSLVSTVGNRVATLACEGKEVLVSDRIVLNEKSPIQGREGRYQLHLNLKDATGTPLPLEEPDSFTGRVYLGPITVIHSKTAVLEATIRGESTDYRLALRVILSLLN